MKKKTKIRKVEKKSNFEKKLKKKEKKQQKKGKVTQKKRKEKKSGKESLWISVVIHSEMCVGKQ